MAQDRDTETKQSSSSASCQRELAQLRGVLGKPLQSSELQQEPFRSILRKAGKTLNVRGKQFYNLVDINLSDDEPDPQPPRRLSGPPSSITLKRAFGITEPRKSGQSLTDFLGDRWVEFKAPDENNSIDTKSTSKNRKHCVQPDLSVSIYEIRRPWFTYMSDEQFNPPDSSRPEPDPNDTPPSSPDPENYCFSR